MANNLVLLNKGTGKITEYVRIIWPQLESYMTLSLKYFAQRGNKSFCRVGILPSCC
jgi:hypothetical protein